MNGLIVKEVQPVIVDGVAGVKIVGETGDVILCAEQVAEVADSMVQAAAIAEAQVKLETEGN